METSSTVGGALSLGGFTESGHSSACTLSGAGGMRDVSPDTLPCLRAEIADRPVWVAGSTHEGEEESECSNLIFFYFFGFFILFF